MKRKKENWNRKTTEKQQETEDVQNRCEEGMQTDEKRDLFLRWQSEGKDKMKRKRERNEKYGTAQSKLKQTAVGTEKDE